MTRKDLRKECKIATYVNNPLGASLANSWHHFYRFYRLKKHGMHYIILW